MLAAATAFTFAPVANLGNAVTAEASTAFENIGDIHLTVDGDTATYDINFNNTGDNDTYKVYSADTSKVTVDGSALLKNVTVSGTPDNSAYGTGYIFKNGTSFTVTTGAKTGDVVLTLVHGTTVKPWTIHVDPKSSEPKWKLDNNTVTITNNSGVDLTQSGNATFNVKVQDATDLLNAAKFATLSLNGNADDGTTYTITSANLTNNSSSYVKIINQNTVKTDNKIELQYLAKGTATLQVGLRKTDGTGVNKNITINVSKADSTMKIGDTFITNTNDTSNTVVKTITLTGDNPTGEIGATLEDAQGNEKLTYTVYKVNKDGIFQDLGSGSDYTGAVAVALAANTSTGVGNASHKIVSSNDLTVDSTGKVTATANALNAVEQYYDILVSNNINSKAAWVRVVSIRTSKAFTNVSVTVDGNTYTKSAEYDKAGNVVDGTDTKNLKLSMTDFTSAPFTALGNGAALPAANISSSDSTVVAVENGALVAKKLGTAVVTFTAKSDTTHYGNATLRLNVTVTNNYIKNEITADDIVLTVSNPKAKINAKSTPATKYSYEVGHGTADKWTAQSDSHISISGDTVTFDGLGYGQTQIRITGAATNNADAPKAKVINVKYSNITDADLKVTTKSLKLNEGETGSIVATGTALSYTSSDEDVATVDSTGKVTGVSEGTAVIIVKSAGSATVEPAQDTVIVTVKAVYKNPAKVTGVKVSNKKGAKVTVTYTKDTTSPTVKYYVQKKVSGKTAGKSVGSTKTTLSVKKGATVKVRVKAYYYDANGVKHVGAYSSWKTLKTDKK